MTSFPSGISTIIFDLGGVLVDLSVEKTINAFAGLSGWAEHQVAEVYQTHSEFFAFERGEISDTEFRNVLRRIFKTEASDQELDKSWNAMLIGLPAKKLEMVAKLKQQFQVVVLSNTNNIHLQCINKNFLGGETLNTHFNRCYFSHEVGMRKPEPRIYKHVLQHQNIISGSVVFLDDNVENLQAAQTLGIHTIHIQHAEQVFTIFKNVI